MTCSGQSCRINGIEYTIEQDGENVTLHLVDLGNRLTDPGMFREILQQAIDHFFEEYSAGRYLVRVCDTEGNCICDGITRYLAQRKAEMSFDFSTWILEDGTWDDSGRWIDLAIWE